jgi:hypothetical protein
MKELIIAGLALTLFSYIVVNVVKNKKKNTSKVMHRQSDVHKLLKYFFSIPLYNNENNFSQLTKHKQKGIIKVIVLGNQAYWVSNNIFYVADAIDGKVQKHTAKPVDIEGLPKVDLDKMLFILDSLRDGKRDDSGSTGNK